MQTKVYLQVPGDRGYNYVPYENFKWTGRWKIHSVVKTREQVQELQAPGSGYQPVAESVVETKLFVERQVGIFFWWKCWESYDNFTFIEEECFINECEVI